MWILFEKTDNRFGEYIGNYESVGYSLYECDALCWVSRDPEKRCFKFCPRWEVE